MWYNYSGVDRSKPMNKKPGEAANPAREAQERLMAAEIDLEQPDNLAKGLPSWSFPHHRRRHHQCTCYNFWKNYKALEPLVYSGCNLSSL